MDPELRNVDWKETFWSIVQDIQKENPKFVIRYKNESKLMKIIGFLMFFSKGFMERVTTTIGTAVYFPSEEYLEKSWYTSVRILMHERIHLRQFQKYGFFKMAFLKYLFPIPLALFGFLGFLCFIHGAFALLFFFFLFAMPVPFFGKQRWELEWEAYKWNLTHEYLASKHYAHYQWKIMNKLSGWRYYQMVSFYDVQWAVYVFDSGFYFPMAPENKKIIEEIKSQLVYQD